MKTFVIHYDKLVGRKINMLKQLEENGMDAEFISNRGKDVLTETDKHPFSKLNDSEISLFLHHYECFKKIIENQADFALILEDDALFNNSFDEILKKYIKHLPGDWDMLFLGDGCGLHIPNAVLNKCKNCNIFRNDSTRCTDSYLISKKCALKLVNTINNENFSSDLPIDFWLNLIIEKEKLKIYWAEPTIVTQGTQNGCFKSSLR